MTQTTGITTQAGTGTSSGAGSGTAGHGLSATQIAGLIACPACDAVYTAVMPENGERACCTRCGHVLIAPRQGAGKRIIAVSLAVVVLVLSAAFYPFLSISEAGLANTTSIMQAAMSFTESGMLTVLSLALVLMIVLIPAARALLAVYVILPLTWDRPPWPHAAAAFRLAERLRPWSMAEIFAIGCAVALVKIGAMVSVVLGPAFWMFAVLVVLVVIQDTLMCRYSVWTELDRYAS